MKKEKTKPRLMTAGQWLDELVDRVTKRYYEGVTVGQVPAATLVEIMLEMVEEE